MKIQGVKFDGHSNEMEQAVSEAVDEDEAATPKETSWLSETIDEVENAIEGEPDDGVPKSVRTKMGTLFWPVSFFPPFPVQLE